MRRLILRHRTVASLVLAAALAMRLLVPAGFMPDSAAGRLRLILCPAAGPVAAAPMSHATMSHAMAHHGHQHPDSAQDAPCAFAGLALAALPPVDPILLAAAILFAMALAALGSVLPPPHRAAFLRPPLRGPPPLG